VGVGTFSFSNWLPVLAARASETGQRTKSCILLWMDGGPSHKDTFDLRPGTDNGGPFQAIDTNVAGIRISEHLPQMARLMITRPHPQHEHFRRRHGRAKYNMHTGYREGQGGVLYPSIGAIAAKEIGNQKARCRTSSQSATAATAPASSVPAISRWSSTIRIAASKTCAPPSKKRSSTPASACSTNSKTTSTARIKTASASPTARRCSGPSR